MLPVKIPFLTIGRHIGTPGTYMGYLMGVPVLRIDIEGPRATLTRLAIDGTVQTIDLSDNYADHKKWGASDPSFVSGVLEVSLEDAGKAMEARRASGVNYLGDPEELASLKGPMH